MNHLFLFPVWILVFVVALWWEICHWVDPFAVVFIISYKLMPGEVCLMLRKGKPWPPLLNTKKLNQTNQSVARAPSIMSEYSAGQRIQIHAGSIYSNPSFIQHWFFHFDFFPQLNCMCSSLWPIHRGPTWRETAELRVVSADGQRLKRAVTTTSAFIKRQPCLALILPIHWFDLR